jgi:hypothetical protein
MALLQSPDVFGHTIICDDIRQEEGTGKLFYIGVYNAAILTHSPFPFALSLAFAISISQRRAVFVPKVGIRIFLPGDQETQASFQADVGETSEGAVASQLQQARESIHPDAQAPPDESFPTMRAIFKFQQFNIPQPGLLKVRAVIGDDMIRIGGIAVSPFPTAAT